ncbi:MAG: TetR/AcrR family transcriptional regulator [Bacteroidota bacterium]
MEQLNSSQALSRKEREKFARQQEILKAARELFIRKGYHDTTLEEIAHHAEFGKGTIYNYFSSKEELFNGIINSLVDEMFELVQSAIAVSGHAREKLTAYASAMISHARSNADLFRLIFQEFHRANSPEFKENLKHFHERTKKIQELIIHPIEEEISAGKIRPVDARELISLFDGMLRSYCLNYLENQFQFQNDDVDTAAALIVSVFFDGAAEPNRKG